MGNTNFKLCPFCGSPAKRLVQPAGDCYTERDYRCAMYCSNADCGATIQFIYCPPPWIKDPLRQAKTKIAKAWNRRAKS